MICPVSTPDGLELHHLRAFVAVARERHFGRAAEQLHVSASTLSRSVSALERMLGCVLLRRTPPRVTLTMAGEALLAAAPIALDAVDEAVATTRAVGGELAARIARLGEPFTSLTCADVESLRVAAERHYALLPIPDEVTFRPVIAHGVPGLVAEPERSAPGMLLLLHGGAYVNGSAYGFRSLAGALATATGRTVLTPDYRLAPEHPFPAAIDDAHAAHTWAAAQGPVLLFGETTGAGLALSLLHRLRAEGAPLPAGAVLATPWIDPSAAASLPAEPAPSGTPEGVALGVSRYLNGVAADDPRIDPFHDDLTGTPPLLLQIAGLELRMGEGERLAARARMHGVPVTVETYPVAAPAFHLYWSFLPDAAQALEAIARFTDDRISSLDLSDETHARAEFS
jgi:acetyl esterase/lipase